MGSFLRQAEEILEIASADAAGGFQQLIILFDRQGGLRILDAGGWSFDGLRAEFGAAEIYRVERRGGSVRVEGWDGAQRCLIQRTPPSRVEDLPGGASASYPVMLQFPAISQA